MSLFIILPLARILFPVTMVNSWSLISVILHSWFCKKPGFSAEISPSPGSYFYCNIQSSLPQLFPLVVILLLANKLLLNKDHWDMVYLQRYGFYRVLVTEKVSVDVWMNQQVIYRAKKKKKRKLLCFLVPYHKSTKGFFSQISSCLKCYHLRR